VSFSPVYPFVSFTEWADIPFDVPDKVIDHPVLVVTGMEADGTEFAYPGQGSVQG